MALLTDYTLYADAQAHFSPAALWDLVDGDRERLNIAHECIDRHAARDADAVAVHLAFADGSSQTITFRQIAEASSRFAHYLVAKGIRPGDRVAIMLDPSFSFYVGLFGAMKMGAVAVPLFTLFGADGLRLRVDDCTPRLLLTNTEKAPICQGLTGVEVVVDGPDFMAALSGYPAKFACNSRGEDLAAFQ